MVTICIALKLPRRTDAMAREISAYLATAMPSHMVLGRPFDREAGRIPQPHATLYQGKVDDVAAAEAMWSDVREEVRTEAAVRSENTVYRHNPVGAVEAHWRPTAAWLRLQQKVVEPAHRHCDTPLLDPSGVPNAEILEWLRQQPGEPGNQLRMLEQYKFREIGDDFSPHATLSWLDSRYEARPDGLYTPDGQLTRAEFLDLTELEERYPASGFDDVEYTELACFELGRFGTCVEQIGEPVLLRPATDLRAMQAATTGIAAAHRPASTGPAVTSPVENGTADLSARPAADRAGRTDHPAAGR